MGEGQGDAQPTNTHKDGIPLPVRLNPSGCGCYRATTTVEGIRKRRLVEPPGEKTASGWWKSRRNRLVTGKAARSRQPRKACEQYSTMTTLPFGSQPTVSAGELHPARRALSSWPIAAGRVVKMTRKRGSMKTSRRKFFLEQVALYSGGTRWAVSVDQAPGGG